MSEENPVTLTLNTELSSITEVLQSGSSKKKAIFFFTWPKIRSSESLVFIHHTGLQDLL